MQRGGCGARVVILVVQLRLVIHICLDLPERDVDIADEGASLVGYDVVRVRAKHRQQRQSLVVGKVLAAHRVDPAGFKRLQQLRFAAVLRHIAGKAVLACILRKQLRHGAAAQYAHAHAVKHGKVLVKKPVVACARVQKPLRIADGVGGVIVALRAGCGILGAAKQVDPALFQQRQKLRPVAVDILVMIAGIVRDARKILGCIAAAGAVALRLYEARIVDVAHAQRLPPVAVRARAPRKQDKRDKQAG